MFQETRAIVIFETLVCMLFGALIWASLNEGKSISLYLSLAAINLLMILLFFYVVNKPSNGRKAGIGIGLLVFVYVALAITLPLIAIAAYFMRR